MQSLDPQINMTIDHARGVVRVYGKEFPFDKSGTAHANEQSRAKALFQARHHGRQVLDRLEKEKNAPLSPAEQIRGALTVAPVDSGVQLKMNKGPTIFDEVDMITARIADLSLQAAGAHLKSDRNRLKRRAEALKELLAKKQAEADQARLAAEAAAAPAREASKRETVNKTFAQQLLGNE